MILNPFQTKGEGSPSPVSVPFVWSRRHVTGVLAGRIAPTPHEHPMNTLPLHEDVAALRTPGSRLLPEIDRRLADRIPGTSPELAPLILPLRHRPLTPRTLRTQQIRPVLEPRRQIPPPTLHPQ